MRLRYFHGIHVSKNVPVSDPIAQSVLSIGHSVPAYKPKDYELKFCIFAITSVKYCYNCLSLTITDAGKSTVVVTVLHCFVAKTSLFHLTVKWSKSAASGTRVEFHCCSPALTSLATVLTTTSTTHFSRMKQTEKRKCINLENSYISRLSLCVKSMLIFQRLMRLIVISNQCKFSLCAPEGWQNTCHCTRANRWVVTTVR